MDEGVRINKYLSEAGACSRREADRLLLEGRIEIDGRRAERGERVSPGQTVCMDGVEVRKESDEVILAFHKPRGVVCTTSKKEKNNIVDYVRYATRIYPVGRLDKNSEGLILLTNQGELMDQILRGRNRHEKEYVVKVDRPVTETFLKGMREGVPILDTRTRPCTALPLAEDKFRIILTQGLNRQVRRMCEYFGYRVVRLKRIRIMNITLGNLKVGEYRPLTEDEKKELKQLAYAKKQLAYAKQGGQGTSVSVGENGEENG